MNRVSYAAQLQGQAPSDKDQAVTAARVFRSQQAAGHRTKRGYRTPSLPPLPWGSDDD